MKKALVLAAELQVGDHIKVAGTMVRITRVSYWMRTVDLRFDDDRPDMWHRDQELSLSNNFPVIVWR